jgi:hypothetical protein
MLSLFLQVIAVLFAEDAKFLFSRGCETNIKLHVVTSYYACSQRTKRITNLGINEVVLPCFVAQQPSRESNQKNCPDIRYILIHLVHFLPPAQNATSICTVGVEVFISNYNVQRQMLRFNTPTGCKSTDFR